MHSFRRGVPTKNNHKNLLKNVRVKNIHPPMLYGYCFIKKNFIKRPDIFLNHEVYEHDQKKIIKMYYTFK